MGEVSTAHIMMLIGLVAIGTPILTMLGQFLLQRFSGSGDKAFSEISALKDKVHALELGQQAQEMRVKDHVGEGYASKEDIRRVEKQIEMLADSIKQFTGAVTAMLGPIADQLEVRAVRAT